MFIICANTIFHLNHLCLQGGQAVVLLLLLIWKMVFTQTPNHPPKIFRMGILTAIATSFLLGKIMQTNATHPGFVMATSEKVQQVASSRYAETAALYRLWSSANPVVLVHHSVQVTTKWHKSIPWAFVQCSALSSRSEASIGLPGHETPRSRVRVRLPRWSLWRGALPQRLV